MRTGEGFHSRLAHTLMLLLYSKNNASIWQAVLDSLHSSPDTGGNKARILSFGTTVRSVGSAGRVRRRMS